MGNRFKKTVALLLALGLLTASFSACGKQEKEPETVTRGAGAIEAPITEETTAEETTVAETTTAATTTTKAPTTTAKPQPEKKPGVLANGAALTAAMIGAMGFDYDTQEGVFYTKIDSWQRSAGFIGHYDAVARFGNMHYKTAKMDFSAPDVAGKELNWRIQMWKGHYGAFAGAEIGIYTQEPGKGEEFYDCADDDHMIYMMYDLYLSPADFATGKKYFHRGWQKHWWLTGFKPIQQNFDPADMVMKARIRMHNEELAKKLAEGFALEGFFPGDGTKTMDTYKRAGTDIFFVWHSVGEINY